MNDDRDQLFYEALDRMEATRLGSYQGADISRLIRRLIHRQSEAQGQLHHAVQELHQVAELLRDHKDQPTSQATEARQQIAEDFAQGARALDEAREALMTATKDLNYLRYKFL